MPVTDVPGTPGIQQPYGSGVQANLRGLAPQKQIEAAARLGTKVQWQDPWSKKWNTADFTGIGDLDQTRAMLLSQMQNADIFARKTLALQEQYGSQYIEKSLEQWKQSDPEGYALRKSLGQQLLSEGTGYDMPQGLVDQVQQASRAGAAARGNILGVAPAAMEAFQTGQAAVQLHQQRLANVSSFLNGTTPQAQFGALATAQQGASPLAMLPIQGGVGVDPNSGWQGAALRQQQYATDVSLFVNNPWNKMLAETTGKAIQGGMSMMGSFI